MGEAIKISEFILVQFKWHEEPTGSSGSTVFFVIQWLLFSCQAVSNLTYLHWTSQVLCSRP